MSPPRRGRESPRPGRPCDHRQRAVPHLRSGPRPVSPVSAHLRAFVALLRTGWHPCPSGEVKRGVAPLWADCDRAAVLTPPRAHFAAPKRPSERTPRAAQSARFRAIQKVRFLCWIKRWLTACHTAPQRGSGRTGKRVFHTVLSLFPKGRRGSDFELLRQLWLRDSKNARR